MPRTTWDTARTSQAILNSLFQVVGLLLLHQNSYSSQQRRCWGAGWLLWRITLSLLVECDVPQWSSSAAAIPRSPNSASNMVYCNLAGPPGSVFSILQTLWHQCLRAHNWLAHCWVSLIYTKHWQIVAILDLYKFYICLKLDLHQKLYRYSTCLPGISAPLLGPTSSATSVLQLLALNQCCFMCYGPVPNGLVCYVHIIILSQTLLFFAKINLNVNICFKQEVIWI